MISVTILCLWRNPTFSVASILVRRFSGDGSASIIALYFAQKREEDELEVPLSRIEH